MSWNSLAIMNFQGSDLPSASGPQRKKLKLLWVEIKLCPIEGFLKIVQIKVIKRCFHISERNLPKNDWLNSYKNEKPKSIKVKSFFFFLLYNIVLVLPYINMHLPRVYTCSPSWTPLPPSSPYHPSGSSQCTSPKLPVSCIKPGLAICFLYDIIHVLMPYWMIFSLPTNTWLIIKTFYFRNCIILKMFTTFLMLSRNQILHCQCLR